MAPDQQTTRLPVSRAKSAVLIFFLSFFVLMSSGHMSGLAAGQQLSAATMLATQHALGIASPPDQYDWVRSPQGRYYEPHDIGAILLMLPGAWLGAQLDHSSAATQFLRPPLVATLAVSLTYAVVSAIGCLFMFLLFTEFYPDKLAFLITFAFAAGSLYLPYAKGAWDEAPCAAAMCAFLYFAHGLLRPGAGIRAFVAAGCALAIVCLFHYSITPALLVALVFLAWRTHGSLRLYLILAATFVVCAGPMWAYNALRTGSPFHPSSGALFDLSGGLLHGLSGLLIGANRGLIVFSPIVIAGLFLPWAWPRLQGSQRVMLESMLLGMLLYTCTIAGMNRWDEFGWGSPYLLPCLPIVFLIVGPCLVEIGSRSRFAAAAIVIAAIGFNVAPAMIDWQPIVAAYPPAELQDASVPYAIEGIWAGFIHGLRGEPLPFGRADAQVAQTGERARFPDLWTVQLMERSRAGHVAGWTIVGTLILGMGLAWGRIFAARRQRDGLTDAALRALMQDIPNPRHGARERGPIESR